MSKQFEKYSAIIKNGRLTERDILNLKRLLNGWSVTSTTKEERIKLEKMLWDAYDNGGLDITPEQTLKGWNWLKDQWRTPRGIERKHNPFGYREEAVLEHFHHFKFLYFYDCASVYLIRDGKHDYQPVYGVYTKDGAGFSYYMQRGSGYNGGSVEIIE